MKSYHFSKEQYEDVVSIIHFMAGYEMSHLAKPIHYHKDGIKRLCVSGSPKMKSMLMSSHGA